MPAASEFPVAPALALVATTSTRLPNAAKIVAACDMNPKTKRGLLGSLFGPKDNPSPEYVWDGNILFFPLRDAQIAVSLMPVPIPWSSLEGPCETAWWWPNATEAMHGHSNHFIVAIIGGTIEPVERRVILTRVVSEVVSNTDAVGVYWGEGTLVHEPKEFVARASSINPEDIPGTLWIDVRVEENEDGTFRCFTTGMAPLGFLEIEVENSNLAPDELMGFVGDTACYIVNKRLRIPDGDTMGRTAAELYQVRHGRSMFDRANVMHLVMR
ncbi:MAG: DUF4261 domain-containing protein [Planctomycetaceae bacterium]